MNQIWLNGRRTFYFPVFDPVMVLNAMAPIDWNFNGRTDEHPVRHDVNGDNRFDVLSVINEWEALDFSGDGIGTETMYYRIEPTMSSAKNCTPLH